MKCPHCTKHFHDNFDARPFARHGNVLPNTSYRTAYCPACKDLILEIKVGDNHEWRMVYPGGANRGPVPPAVPMSVAGDYTEACNVLPISPKASAALARRCLQTILREHGYKAKDLAQEIQLLLDEPSPAKGIPVTLRTAIDGIRNFGNFSAHPITDKSTLQIIDVEPHEAEWCLEIIEEMFDHFYVRPAHAKAKKAALDAKLATAGKPPSK